MLHLELFIATPKSTIVHMNTRNYVMLTLQFNWRDFSVIRETMERKESGRFECKKMPYNLYWKMHLSSEPFHTNVQKFMKIVKIMYNGVLDIYQNFHFTYYSLCEVKNVTWSFFHLSNSVLSYSYTDINSVW